MEKSAAATIATTSAIAKNINLWIVSLAGNCEAFLLICREDGFIACKKTVLKLRRFLYILKSIF